MELRYILGILWRRRWLATGIFVSIFLTIVIGSLLITTWYDSTALVLLKHSPAASSMLKSIGLSDSSSTTALSDTDRSDYLALAAIRPIAEKTISELNLKRLRTRARLMNAIPGLKPVLRFLGVDVNATEEVMTAEDLLKPSILTSILPRPYVSIDQYEETDIIEIEGLSPSPKEAMMIANKMANYFIEEELRRVRNDYLGAKVFIDKNIIKANEEYLEALKSVKDLKEKEKFSDLDTETTSIIQKIADFKKSVEDNKLSIHKLNASINNIDSQIKSISKYQKSSEQFKDDDASLGSNDTVVNLKTTLRELYLSLAETKTKYTKDHPSVIDIENKIAQTKKLLQKETAKIFGAGTVTTDTVYQELTQKRAGYYADIAGYKIQNEILPQIINSYESEMMKLPAKVAEYSKRQLAVTVTQNVYNSLLTYQYQIGMAESASLSNIYLVESAIEAKTDDSKHKHPGLLLNTVMAIILGFMFGIGGTLFIEYLDDTIKSSKDIKLFSELTFLGSILRLNKKDPRIISHTNPRFPLNEFIRNIRNNIKYASLDRALKSIIVTSTLEQEGKSFFVVNLAISVANEGKKVLVIDGDLRKPSINKYFGLPQGLGLTNYLVNDVELKDIQLETGIDGLHVILPGPIPEDPGNLVEANKLHNLIKEMATVYDLVIVDTPPLMAASDALILGGYVDGGIMVVQSGRVSGNHFREVIDSLKMANINLFGVVLNQVHKSSSTYYYYGDYK